MMLSKRPWFSGGRRADPEDRSLPGLCEPANQGAPEAGAQRGSADPGAPELEVDLLSDEDEAPRGRILSLFVTLAALAVFGGIAWYVYDWRATQFEIMRLPVILADSGPIESHPENPAGIEPPTRDVAVLNDAAPAETVAKLEELLGPSLETAAGPPGKMPAAEKAQPLAAPSTAPLAAPQAVAAGQPEAGPEPVLPEPKAEAAEITAEPPAAPAVAASEPTPQVAALSEAKTGGFVVQVVALKARDGARLAWARLQEAHPALLGDRELAIQRVDLGDRGIFFRVQAGFFAERAGARDLCNALKARGQDCLVAKR